MHRILVVDDERDIAAILVEVLEMAGYSATCVYNGMEALTHMEENGIPDLVIADLRMPVMNGRALVETMRSQPRTAKTPIILITGAVPGTDDFPASEAYNELIVKPFDITHVAATVATCIQGSI